MDTSILVGIAAVVTIIICIAHFKLRNFATLILNVLLVVVILYLFHRTLGGLMAGTIASVLISFFLLLWSPLKKIDKELKDK